MLTFCPTCGSMLAIETRRRDFFEAEEDIDYGDDVEAEEEEDDDDKGGLRLSCKTCPYSYAIRGKFWSKTDVPMMRHKKRVDDVLGGDDAWKNVDTTRSRCPKCAHDVAYFLLVQTRSADEPMTQFFRCTACKNQWKEN